MDIAETLAQTTVRRAIQYKHVYLKMKKQILSMRPRSRDELKERVQNYLLQYPFTARILEVTGVTEDRIVDKLSRYV